MSRVSDALRVAQEVGEQRELARGHRHGLAGALGAVTVEVDADVAELAHRLAAGAQALAAQRGVDAGAQLGEVEGLA